MTLDMSPKILNLPREDCAICFAGETVAAYPIMLQIATAISAHGPARDRNLDVCELKEHLLRICTDIIDKVVEIHIPFLPSDGQFIFGGYSWRSKCFRLWTFYFETATKKFRAREAKNFHVNLSKAAFIGDWASRYKRHLVSRLRTSTRHAQLEPLSEIAKLLRATKKDDTIGGAPQIMRVAQHMSVRTFCVLWGDEKWPYLFGRPLFDYERCDFWSIDPDTMRISAPRHFDLNSPKVSRS